MAKRRTITDGRVFVGGRGRKEEAKADRFAKACIRATRKLKNPDPQLSLRFYKGMDPELLNMAYDAIGEGCTYPVLYNDDCIVRDVCHAFGLPEETAVSYVPYGCGEYVIDHESFGTPSGVLNVMKGLELFLDAMGQTDSPDAEYLQGGAGKERMKELKEAAALLKECKKAGISTCVETAGFVPWEAFEKVYGLTDLFLFDYKLDSQEEMDRYTGGKLETILDNLECLAALEKEIILRCPVIPGVNDTDGHFRAIARLAKKCRIRRAELMPYHSWGEPKWEQVGRPYGLSGLKTMTQQEADACRARLDDLMKTENGEE